MNVIWVLSIVFLLMKENKKLSLLNQGLFISRVRTIPYLSKTLNLFSIFTSMHYHLHEIALSLKYNDIIDIRIYQMNLGTGIKCEACQI